MQPPVPQPRSSSLLAPPQKFVSPWRLNRFTVVKRKKTSDFFRPEPVRVVEARSVRQSGVHVERVARR